MEGEKEISIKSFDSLLQAVVMQSFPLGEIEVWVFPLKQDYSVVAEHISVTKSFQTKSFFFPPYVSCAPMLTPDLVHELF